jgi:cell division protein FtsL
LELTVGARAVKIKKAGILTKIIVAVLSIYAVVTLLSIRAQIESAQKQNEELESQIAQQTKTNADLADDIENSGNPDRIKEIARGKLGLVSEGEKVFYDVSN